MSDTVYIPRGRSLRRGRFIPPLLLIPLVLYNIIAFATMGADPRGWSGELFSVPMVSGTVWTLTAGDAMLVLGLVFLFFEVWKSTNTGRTSVLEHMLSVVVFVLFLIEFLLIGAAASSTFFLLLMMSVVDVVAGFTISITGAGRDVTME